MTPPSHSIEALEAYLAQEKFAPASWAKRGLNPSPRATVESMEASVNNACRAALAALRVSEPEPQVKKAIVDALNEIDAESFDTEEREFICTEMASIAKAAGVRIGAELNLWLYGPELGALVNRDREREAAETPLARYTSVCAGCAAPLETEVMETHPSVPDVGWFVVRCNACNALSLIRLGPGAKRMRNVGYAYVARLAPEDFTDASALAHLAELQRNG